MADQNKKQYIKYEDTTYIIEDHRLPDPTAADNGKVLGVANGEYALKREEGGSGAVTSVNGKTGVVVLDAEDVGALPDDTVIPTKTSDLQNDSGFLTRHQSLAAYRTASAQDAIDAAQDTAIAAKYTKPSGGIPASDLAQAVQDALDATSSGLTEEFKQALLDCFENVAWINNQGQTFYNVLYAALYPPVDVLSISAVFNQGSAVIYNTDSLDTLRQYLTVTATYGDTSTGVVTGYTLSGTLTVGMSTVTVLYGGKTTTFIVTVTESALPSSYQKVEYIQSTGTQYILFNSILSGNSATRTQYSFDIEFALDSWQSGYATNIFAGFSTDAGSWLGYLNRVTAIGIGASSGEYFSDLDTSKHSYHFNYENGVCNVVRDDEATISRTLSIQNETAPFSLFTATATGAPNTKFAAKGKIYSCTLYTGETETLNLIPCYRKADNVIGMYDTVTETFFTNSGTGTFSKGSDV